MAKWSAYVNIHVLHDVVRDAYAVRADNVNRKRAIALYKAGHAIVIKRCGKVFCLTSNFGLTQAFADNLVVLHLNNGFTEEGELK